MESIKHINAISLYVADIARSEAFYRTVFEAETIPIDNKNIVVKLDNLVLNLLHMSLAYASTDPGRGPLPMELNIWVADVDGLYERLRQRGLSFLAPPTNQPWGMRNVTFFDPDGHRFELAQAMGP